MTQPAHTLTDAECEQMLTDLLAGLSDDEVEQLGAIAEDAHSEMDGDA